MPEPLERMMAKMMTIGAIGTAMVAPIVLGFIADYYLNLMPLFMVIGAILGLVMGIVQLVRLNKVPKS